MPSLEAGMQIELILDKDKDSYPRPTYYAKTVTVRRFRQLLTVMREIQSATDKYVVLDRAISTIEECLTGWDNVVDPDSGEVIGFTSDRIQDVLTVPEVMELLGKLITGNRLDEGERKNSE